MKKAVIVTAYNNPDYLNCFITQLLFDGTTEVFIHLDKKAESIKKQIKLHEKIHFIENNRNIEWGGYSFLFAILESWREVISYNDYDYIILCSGQDMLLRSDLDAFLKEHPNEIFIDSWEDDKKRRAFLLHVWPSRYFKVIDTKWSLTRMLRRVRIKVFEAGIPILKRKVNYPVENLLFYKNWFWSVIPTDVVKWIMQYIDENPDYLEVFKGFVAEEGFIATTIMISPYKDWLQFDREGKSHSLTFRRKSVDNHPPFLLSNDISDMEKSGMFFARKIRPEAGDEVFCHFNNILFNTNGEE